MENVRPCGRNVDNDLIGIAGRECRTVSHFLEQRGNFLRAEIEFRTGVDVRGMCDCLTFRDIGSDSRLAVREDDLDRLDPSNKFRYGE